MTIFDRIESISFYPTEKKQFGVKSVILWGNSGNTMFPLAYISKPKSISEDDFNQIVKNMEIKLKRP